MEILEHLYPIWVDKYGQEKADDLKSKWDFKIDKSYLPYVLTESEHISYYKFSKGNITIQGTLPDYKRPEHCTAIVIFENDDAFFGINLNREDFLEFCSQSVDKVIGGAYLERVDKIWINYKSFFGYFSTEDYSFILEGLTYMTLAYNKLKTKYSS